MHMSASQDIPSSLEPSPSSPPTILSCYQHGRKSPWGIACVVALTLFTDMIVYGVVIPCLPKVVLDRLGGDSRMVGFLCGSYAFGLLVSTPIFAILSDRYRNRRYPTMAGMLGLVVSTLGFAFADTYSVLVTARVAQGVAGGASWAIGLSMIADVFPSERLGVVMGTVMSAHCVGFTIGPVIGGFLYDYYGFQAPFLFCAAVATLDILAIFCIEEPLVVADQLKKQQMEHKQRNKKLSEEEHANPFAASVNGPNDPAVVMEKKVALFSLMKNRRVLTCVLVTIVSSSVFSGIEPSLPIYLQDTYHCSPATIGFIFGVMVAPAFLSPLIGHLSDKIGRRIVSIVGIAMMAIACPLIALTYSSVYMLIPPLMIFGVSGPVISTPVLPSMSEIVKGMGGNAYAQAYALYNMAYGLGMFLGPVFAGFVVAKYDFETLMTIFSGILLACGLVAIEWGSMARIWINRG